MATVGGKLFTIPAGVPFLDALARAILEGALPGQRRSPPSQLDLAAYTIYLPTRRACRALHDGFLSAAPAHPEHGRATLLPRIRPLGDVDEHALFLTGADLEDPSSLAAEAPAAIPQLERILALSSVVLSWLQKMQRGGLWETSPCDLFASATPANAIELAFELARLADQAQLEGCDLSDLASLASERFADHWRLTLSFLQIVAEQWPQYLRAAGLLDPMQRRNLLLQLEAQRLISQQSSPVIIAGVTRSAPAALALMKAVLASSQGALVLPGLDLDLDEPSWRSIASSDSRTPGRPEHPQYGLKRLLDRLGAARADVSVLPGALPRPDALARHKFLSEALRPAGSTHLWRAFIDRADGAGVRDALAPVSLITAPSPQDEALAIALLLREAAETPGKTASLVTPDRSLARRVAALMRKWDVAIDDSGGSPLAHSRSGAFLDLIAEAASSTAPGALLSLLKHPLARLGLSRPELRKRIRIIEMLAIRQPWFEGGLGGLKRSLVRTEEALAYGTLRHPAINRLGENERAGASDLVERLDRAFAPFLELNAPSGPTSADVRHAAANTKTRPAQSALLSLASLAGAHRAVAEALAQDETGAVADLWLGPAGSALDVLLQRLADAALPSPATPFIAYAPLYRSLVRNEVVRPNLPAHPRLAIWGPLEARLLSPDMVILGGLNEGVWPETPDAGPWLNRPMRAELGLEMPEERIGLGAHDFTQLLCAQEVVLTRALKSGGTPTAPSRWIARINALLHGLGLDRGDAPVLAPTQSWLTWAFARNTAIVRLPPREAPAPCPPVSARPRRLPVTAIEAWLANPYAIFARHILGLEPMADLALGLSASERGQIIHQALAEFCLRHPAELPADIAGELAAIGSTLLTKLSNRAKVRAFWRPRFERFSSWFAETEPARRQDVTRVLGELRGTLTMNGPAGPFTLTARADRIDLTSSGSLVIYDYKSGSAPTEQAVLGFRSPQLPLEALIASQGGFLHPNGACPELVTVAKLAYITAGGGEPPGDEIIIKKQTPAALAKAADEGVSALIARFDQPATPYRALRRTAFDNSYRYDAYVHLSRVTEWLSSFETE